MDHQSFSNCRYLLIALPEHQEHTIGDTKATKDVDRRNASSNAPEDASRRTFRSTNHEETSEDDHAGESIASAHQRTKESRFDIRDEVVPKKAGKDKVAQLLGKRNRRIGTHNAKKDSD
jgi:hypothetical protein